MIMAKAARKTNIFTALAHNSKLEDKHQSIKSVSVNGDDNPVSERLSLTSGFNN